MIDDDRPVCPGPHDKKRRRPHIDQAAGLCQHCRATLRTTISTLLEMYIHASIAIEPGQRHREETRTGGKKTPSAEAPLPLDPEPMLWMQRALEVVLSWHAAIIEAAELSTDERPMRSPAWRTYRFTDQTSRVWVARRRGHPSNATAGVAWSTACRTISAHLDTLLTIRSVPLTRSVPPRGVTSSYRAYVLANPDRGVIVPMLDDATPGHVFADGHAVVITELSGVEGALELFALERDGRRMLGLTREFKRFPVPCPNPDCGQLTLVLPGGTSTVLCESCDESWSEADIERLILVLADEHRTKGESA